MSITYGFYNSLNGDRRYTAEQMSSIFNGIINDGVFMSIGDQLKVSATDGMNVIVGSGRAWFNGTWTDNDAEYYVTIPASELVLTRIDAVVLEVNTNEHVRANSIKVVSGTPSANPSRPTLTNNVNTHQYPLAYVTVNANATSIKRSDIANAVGTSQCPWITGILETVDTDELIEQWSARFDEIYARLEDAIAQALAEEIVDGSVTTPKIVDGAVTAAKVNPAGMLAKIGALSVNGGDVSGNLNFGNANKGLSWTMNDGTVFQLRPYVSNNIIQFVLVSSGGTSKNAFGIKSDGTITTDYSIPVASGGTGAKNAADARANLGITPSNIGALSTGGGTLNGWVKFDGTTIGHEWKTADGTIFQIRPYTAGNLFQIVTRTADGKTVASLDVKNDGSVQVGKPVDFRRQIGALSVTDDDTVTGFPTFQHGIKIHHIDSRETQSAAGYLKIATWSFTSDYANIPIILRIMSRGGVSDIIIRHLGQATTDPGIDYFVYSGSMSAYLHKESAGVWSLYFQCQAYDSVTVVDYTTTPYTRKRINWTWKSDFVSSVPSGSIAPNFSAAHVRPLIKVGSESEYENPPMIADVEYRTTERWQGKVVYAAYLGFGSLPNNSWKSADVDLYPKEIISHNVVCNDASGHRFTNTEGLTFSAAAVYGGKMQLQLRTSNDLSTVNCGFLVKYTKN